MIRAANTVGRPIYPTSALNRPHEGRLFLMTKDSEGVLTLTLRMSWGWLAALACLLVAPWLFVLIGARQHHPVACDLPLSSSATTNRILRARGGPWGDLRITRIVTEPPVESLAGYLVYPRPTWHFKGYTADDLRNLLLSAGLSQPQQAELLATATFGPAQQGFVAHPSDTLLRALRPDSRAILYGALSLFPENVFQHEPFRFRADLESEWFEASGVPESTVEKVRQLTYRRGKTLLFSDPHLILPGLPSDQERVRLLKALARQSTLLIHLRITEHTDVDALVSYWSARGSRAKDIRPLLDSIARSRTAIDLDIAHLLPRFARKRLYTYPSADGDRGELIYDCHWNSMNFWNDPPVEAFADGATVIRTLESDYDVVLGDFQFGDIVLFMKSETQAIHSAVYIADDIVFTKNGPSPHSPWILMQLDTLVSHYETNIDLTLKGYRMRRR